MSRLLVFAFLLIGLDSLRAEELPSQAADHWVISQKIRTGPVGVRALAGTVYFRLAEIDFARSLVKETTKQKRFGLFEQRQLAEIEALISNSEMQPEEVDMLAFGHDLSQIVPRRDFLGIAYLEMEGLAALRRDLFIELGVIDEDTRSKIDDRLRMFSSMANAIGGIGIATDSDMLEKAENLCEAITLCLSREMTDEQFVSLAKLVRRGKSNGTGVALEQRTDAPE